MLPHELSRHSYETSPYSRCISKVCVSKRWDKKGCAWTYFEVFSKKLSLVCTSFGDILKQHDKVVERGTRYGRVVIRRRGLGPRFGWAIARVSHGWYVGQGKAEKMVAKTKEVKESTLHQNHI